MGNIPTDNTENKSINASFHCFQQVVILWMKEQVEQEVIITNHKLLFHFSDPSKKMLHAFLRMNLPVKTLTNLRLYWSWSVTKSVTKLKGTSFKLYLSIFFCRRLNKRNWRSLLEFSRIDSFPFSIPMVSPPHVHAEATLTENYWVPLSVVFYKIESINLYFRIII